MQILTELMESLCECEDTVRQEVQFHESRISGTCSELSTDSSGCNNVITNPNPLEYSVIIQCMWSKAVFTPETCEVKQTRNETDSVFYLSLPPLEGQSRLAHFKC